MVAVSTLTYTIDRSILQAREEDLGLKKKKNFRVVPSLEIGDYTGEYPFGLVFFSSRRIGSIPRGKKK